MNFQIILILQYECQNILIFDLQYKEKCRIKRYIETDYTDVNELSNYINTAVRMSKYFNTLIIDENRL